jgi:hypothetical protein
MRLRARDAQRLRTDSDFDRRVIFCDWLDLQGKNL